MKTCPTCHVAKIEVEFYADRRSKDGLKSQCKKCHTSGNIRTRDEDKKRAANARHMASARATDPEKFRARDRAAATGRRGVSPEKVAARAAVNNAVKRGSLIKPTACEACGESKKLTGHHDDYSRPLTVRWLCYGCHGKEHRVVDFKRIAP